MKKTVVFLLLSFLLSCLVFSGPKQIFASNDDNYSRSRSRIQPPTYPQYNEFMQMQEEWIQIETTMGTIILELNPHAAPKTCMNFRNLVKAGFYNGIIFHRVIEDFMIQSGGFTATEKKELGYTFENEINPLALGMKADDILMNEKRDYKYDFNLPSMKHLQGVISMAHAGPNTNTSQFFIVSSKEGAWWLDGVHTVFGHVVEGMDIVLAIEKVPTIEADKPLEDITIISVQIIEKPETVDEPTDPAEPEDPAEPIIITLKIGSYVATISGECVEINPPPLIHNGRTLVPLRFFSDAFGAEVEYDTRTRGITIRFQDKTISMQIGNHTVIVNGRQLRLDVPPWLIENRTFIPLRAISEIFGAEIEWDASTETIIIILHLE